MPDSAPRPPAGIFISYRREEAAYPAGWLYDRLRDRYAGQVFKDVDSIRPGDDFVEAITEAVASCVVLLALIGDQWLTITDASGRRRLDDRGDFVRVTVDASARNRVRAECTNVVGQPAVHLALWLDGDGVVDYTDARDPLLSGTVGVFVATTDRATSTGVVEFDDFAGWQL